MESKEVKWPVNHTRGEDIFVLPRFGTKCMGTENDEQQGFRFSVL